MFHLGLYIFHIHCLNHAGKLTFIADCIDQKENKYKVSVWRYCAEGYLQAFYLLAHKEMRSPRRPEGNAANAVETKLFKMEGKYRMKREMNEKARTLPNSRFFI